MRVFITGASGHIGSAVVPELLGAGHRVVGLARSDASAQRIAALGGEVRHGDIDDLDGLREAAAAADGVIHLAFKHEAMRTGDLGGAISSDMAAITAIGEALEGTGKPFVGTSGTLLLAMAGIDGRPATEQDLGNPGHRVDAENYAVSLAERGVRSSVIRLTPTVHSNLDLHGFIPALIGFAREHGSSAYVADGSNRWPAVHTRDAARLYRLALESAPAGARLHGVADEGVPFRTIAETIAERLGVAAVSVPAAEAEAHLGFLALFAQLDNPASSALTRELLGWSPTHPGLIADMREEHYFAQARSAAA